jgi:hypothetical protein
MFRIAIFLGLFFVTLGAPQPQAGPMHVTFYDGGIRTTRIMPPENKPAIHPVSRFVFAVRETFLQACARELATHRPGNPRPAPPVKEIIISLENQELYRFEDGRIVSRHPVSTGVPGHRTPTGDYRVHNKNLSAWSNKYECMMLHWMSICGSGLYGIHSLRGTSYLKKLGRVASHGCIRLSHEDAESMYNWADIGTPVTIVNEFDPTPYLQPPVRIPDASEQYEPGIF